MDKLLLKGASPCGRGRHFRGEECGPADSLCLLLSDQALRLTNVPHLNDIATMLRLLARWVSA